MGEAILPTPVVGAVGLIEKVEHRAGMAFQVEGDVAVLLGPLGAELGGSEYLALEHGMVAGEPPNLDLELEARVQECCRMAIRDGMIRSAHDCSEGGLAVTLAESCIAGNIGLRCALIPAGRWDVKDLLFGETQVALFCRWRRRTCRRWKASLRRWTCQWRPWGWSAGEVCRSTPGLTWRSMIWRRCGQTPCQGSWPGTTEAEGGR